MNKIFTPYVKTEFFPSLSNDSYGYGWFIYRNSNGSKIVFHTGVSTLGFTSSIIRNIGENYVIIIMSNKANDESINNIPNEVFKILESK